MSCSDPYDLRAVRQKAAKSAGLVDQRLLDFLVCPVSRQALTWDAGKHELVSINAGLAFPVRDGIPVMLIEMARRIG